MLIDYSPDNPSCFISDKLKDWSKDDLRRRVCAYLPTVKFQDNYYCVLHLPTKDKAVAFFDEFWKKCEKKDYNFDWSWFPQFMPGHTIAFEGEVSFRHVFFSDYTSFGGSTFDSYAGFDYAIFNGVADFKNARFNHRAIFRGCKFNGDYVTFEHAHFLDFEGDILTIHFNDIISKGIFYFRPKELEGNATFGNSIFEQSANFEDVEFKQFVSFSHASFLGETLFKKVVFRSKAIFSWSTFSQNAFFDRAEFWQSADFSSSSFTSESDVLYRDTKFKSDLNFRYATWGGFLTFDVRSFENIFSEKHIVDFRDVRLETPEKVVFKRVSLHPNWFVGLDTIKFIFTDILWRNVSGNAVRSNVKVELDNLQKRKIINKKALFKITCRQLAGNAEIHNRFDEASNFRQMAMETEWMEKKEIFRKWIDSIPFELEKLKRRVGGSLREEDNAMPPVNSFGIIRRSGDFIIHWLYRLTSFYGESWFRAIILLLVILFLSAFLYTQFDFYVCPLNGGCAVSKLKWFEAITHSIHTAFLQNSESRKPFGYSELFVVLEKIFAPIQAALLLLAIRRKFMR